MDTDLAPPPEPTFSDRSVLLTLVGVFLILAALFMISAVPLSVLIVSMQPRGTAAPASATIVGSLSYLLVGAFVGTMGVGTIMGRRWARSIMLAASWLSMVMGVLSLVAMVLVLPRAFHEIQVQPGPKMEPLMIDIVIAVTIAFSFAIYVFIPALLVLFYRGPNVRATFEHKDPKPRWTDRMPTSVLALALLLAMTGIFLLISIGYGPVVPMFGGFVTGIPGAGILLAQAGLVLAVAGGVCRLRPWAWWAALTLGVAWTILGAATLLPMDLPELYEVMGYPPQQIEIMKRMNFWSPSLVISGLAIGSAIYFSFLIGIRKHFVGGAPRG